MRRSLNPNLSNRKSQRRRRKSSSKRSKTSKNKQKSINSLIWDFPNNNPYKHYLLPPTISKLQSNSSLMESPISPNNPTSSVGFFMILIYPPLESKLEAILPLSKPSCKHFHSILQNCWIWYKKIQIKFRIYYLEVTRTQKEKAMKNSFSCLWTWAVLMSKPLTEY